MAIMDSNCSDPNSALKTATLLQGYESGAALGRTILNCSRRANNSLVLDSIQNKTTEAVDSGYNYFTIILLTMLASIFVIGTIGNSVVCYVFGFKQRKRRSVPEMLFLYLGAIDLTSSIVNPSLYIYWTVTRYSQWDFGIFACKILVPLAPISVTLSALIILIISIDRYFVICSQFGRSYSRNRIHLAVIFAAIFATCLYVPYMIRLQITDQHSCTVYQTTDPLYAYSTIIALLLQDFGFIVVLTVTNSKSFSHLQRKGSVVLERSLEARRVRSNRRVAKILLAMSCVFCLLVLPRDIMQLTFILSWLDPPGVHPTATVHNMNALFKVLQTANSCVNVFIYSKMHTKFRSHLLSLCYSTCGKRHSLSNDLQVTMLTMTNITPRLRKRMFRLRADSGTPSDTPDLQRKQMGNQRDSVDVDVGNPLLASRSNRLSRVRFQADKNCVRL